MNNKSYNTDSMAIDCDNANQNSDLSSFTTKEIQDELKRRGFSPLLLPEMKPFPWDDRLFRWDDRPFFDWTGTPFDDKKQGDNKSSKEPA